MDTEQRIPPQSAQVKDFGQSPSQTLGPFFAYGLTAEQYGYAFSQVFNDELASPHAEGEHITITGTVMDGDGVLVPDAIVEILHVNSHGVFPSSRADALAQGFTGFGRMGTGTEKGFAFKTIKPKAVGENAPCVHVVLTMRGLLMHLFTRIYFSDEAAANAKDPALQLVPEARRHTLIAQRMDSASGPQYRFDVRLQSQDPNLETVFIDN
jgi:protocatechuate 3,4-dioxygenase, alpha subunit